MNINAIYKKAVNNGYEVKTVTTNSGKYAIIVEGWNTPDFYNCIHSIYRKCNVHINFHYATNQLVLWIMQIMKRTGHIIPQKLI